jgi:uncharacterized protein
MVLPLLDPGCVPEAQSGGTWAVTPTVWSQMMAARMRRRLGNGRGGGAIDPGQIGAERPRLESAQFVRKLSHARIRTSDFGDTHPPRAISDAFWAAAELGSGPIVVDRAECMQLLAAKSVGRVPYATDTGARILPVNYVLGADCVIFRTVPDGEVFRYALNSTCVFEIDETNEFFESGWSVVAVGRLQLATEDDFAQMRYGRLPEPWAAGSRWMFVRLPCEHVSGRRVIGAGPWT